MKKICFVTGSRAEYNLLKPIMEGIKSESNLILQIIATGSHLSPEFGLTYKNIENDGFFIDKKIEVILSSDTETAVNKAIGLGIISFSDAYESLKPDLLVVLGDRYEILASVISAMVCKIKIAHIHGGELTEGAIDDAIRHSITKMSNLHFASTEEYKTRIMQLGEQPENIFNVGSVGVENIKKLKLMSKADLEENLNFKFEKNTAIVTFHSETLDEKSPEYQFKQLLNALDEIENLKIIFTKSNADFGGRIINSMIDEYVLKNKNVISFTSMGQLRYFSALQYADIVIGNSSSGIIEVPSFKIPTVNIGNRQKGRIYCKSIINCHTEKCEIKNAIKMGLSNSFKSKNITDLKNPYENENTVEKILLNIIQFLEKEEVYNKKFYDILKK